MNKYLVAAVAFLVMLLGLVFLKGQVNDLKSELSAADTKASKLQTMLDQSAQALANRDLLDIKITRELNDAKFENDKLRSSVAAGTARVRVKASCPASLSTTSGATSMDDAAEPTLDAAAREDYFRLRDQIILTEKQLQGLQGYVKNVCLSAAHVE